MSRLPASYALGPDGPGLLRRALGVFLGGGRAPIASPTRPRWERC